MRTKAIVSFVYGEAYLAMWRKHCEANWRAYAERHGYDIVLLDKPVRAGEDLARRPINWQKLLVCGHPSVRLYEDVVFLDADIMINYHRAPCVVTGLPAGGIGVVRFDGLVDDAFNYYKIFIRQAKFRHYRDRARRRAASPGVCRLGGVDFGGTYARYSTRTDLPLINTGVLVMKPAVHREYLEGVYHDSFGDVENGAEKGNYEQEYLSFRLIRDNQAVFLDERFNRLAHFEQALHYPFVFASQDPVLWKLCISTLLANSYFLHFAGNANLMPFAVTDANEEFAMLGVENPFRGDAEVVPSRGRGGAVRATPCASSTGGV